MTFKKTFICTQSIFQKRIKLNDLLDIGFNNLKVKVIKKG